MELLLEIGTEEIPSTYIPETLKQSKELAEKMLQENRISYREVRCLGTPRRIVLIVEDIAEKQEDSVQEIKGPPKKVSFDKDGNPTKAAISFAKKHNVSLDEIQTINTSKGEYLFLRKVIPGTPTFDILKDEIPRLISKISFPKSMRWGTVKFSFARPIHWILCLLDGRVIPFEIAGIKSGDTTEGHRFMSSGKIKVSGVKDYLKKIEDAHVIVDPEERKRIIKDALKKEAEKVQGIPDDDPELLDSVANLVEFPFPICGSFEERFLSLPAPVIVTPMKEHQRYFPIYNKDGTLKPRFVAINNTVPKDPEVVRKGHERVLKARLTDAEFFFKEDQKIPLLKRLDELKQVIYHSELGTSYEKIERFTKLAEYIADIIAPDMLEDIRLVCKLCKCDLTTLMVSEFPDLQGVMGREYAKIEGYPSHICDAIYEHYLPTGSSDKLPESILGAIVGVADRMDTVCAYFGIGIRPTGSADPFGLRRHAISIIRIIDKMKWDISFLELVKKALAIIKERISLSKEAQKIEEEVISFFKDRFRFMAIADGFRTEVVESVIEASFDKISFLRERIKQMEDFMSHREEDLKKLVLTAKRVSNILKKQKERFDVDPSLFKETYEKGLWDSYLEIRDKITSFVNKNNYLDALDCLLSIKDPIDKLFDNVEILTKDENLRRNRVGLVQKLEALFKEVADFSKFPY